MNVASGTVAPDSGTIEVDGALVERLTPATAAQLGIAIVHQHPALLPDMTVAENVRVALPQIVAPAGRQSRTAIRRILDDVGFKPHLEDRVDSLSVVDKHLLELAKALAVDPGVLILDEPTAPLDQEAVEMLFGHVRRVAAAGSAVIYITHRLAEVRVIADRVTILRDGEVRGVSRVDAVTDDEVLRLIIGRRLESAFPPKADVPATAGFDPGDRRPRGQRLHRHLAGGARRRDRRRRRHRRQRSERAAPRPRRPRTLHRDGFGGRHPLQRRRPAGEVGLHAARSEHRGADDEPDGARERSRLGAATVHPRPVRQPATGGRARHRRAEFVEHAGAGDRGAGVGAVRWQPAEGRDGPHAAVRAGDPRRRRADAGRRRRGAGGDLPHPSVGLGARRPRGRRVVRRPRAARAVRPGDRRLARPQRGRARRRRRHRGSDRQRGDARRATATGHWGRSRAPDFVGAHPLHTWRLRAGGRPRPADDRPRRLHLRSRTTATCRRSTPRR